MDPVCLSGTHFGILWTNISPRPSHKQDADCLRASHPDFLTLKSPWRWDSGRSLLHPPLFPLNFPQGRSYSQQLPFLHSSRNSRSSPSLWAPPASLTTSDHTGAGLTGSRVHSQHLSLGRVHTACATPQQRGRHESTTEGQPSTVSYTSLTLQDN